MSPDAFGLTLLALLVVVLLFGSLLLRLDGLALFAPKTTRQLQASARRYCREGCRTAEGRCPLHGRLNGPADCPLFKFVAADAPTAVYGNPFEHSGA